MQNANGKFEEQLPELLIMNKQLCNFHHAKGLMYFFHDHPIMGKP